MARRSPCLHLAWVLVLALLAPTFSRAAPAQPPVRPYLVPPVPPPPPPPPSPPPPPVTFLRDPEAGPGAAPGGVMRRGTLVEGGPADKHRFLVPRDLPLVTADGQRVTSEDLLGLSLPFSRLSLDQDNIPPIPAGAEGYRRRAAQPPPTPTPYVPYDVDSLGLGRALSSEPVSDPGASLPWPSPPSPNTIVTYYALQPASAATSQTASVKMLPYLSLVESLVGKEAYRWPAASPVTSPPPPPAPPRPVPTSTPVRADPVSRPAAVYGGPGRGVYV